jgi:hypothetical protein
MFLNVGRGVKKHTFSVGVAMKKQTITAEIDEFDLLSGSVLTSLIFFAIAMVAIVIFSAL